jgi:hypothetical protein
MPTIVDLGQKIKAKYPGQYDDMNDADVGRRIKAKFPGSYDDFSDTASVSGMEQLGPLPSGGRTGMTNLVTGEMPADNPRGSSGPGFFSQHPVLADMFKSSAVPAPEAMSVGSLGTGTGKIATSAVARNIPKVLDDVNLMHPLSPKPLVNLAKNVAGDIKSGLSAAKTAENVRIQRMTGRPPVWQGNPEPSPLSSPEFSGTSGQLPTGRKVGGIQNQQPITPRTPASAASAPAPEINSSEARLQELRVGIKEAHPKLTYAQIDDLAHRVMDEMQRTSASPPLLAAPKTEGPPPLAPTQYTPTAPPSPPPPPLQALESNRQAPTVQPASQAARAGDMMSREGILNILKRRVKESGSATEHTQAVRDMLDFESASPDSSTAIPAHLANNPKALAAALKLQRALSGEGPAPPLPPPPAPPPL